MTRIARIILVIYFLLFAVLAVLLRGAAPGPAAQVIQGVRLGSWGGEAGTAYFSGKRLDCGRENAGSAYGETCRIAIAGDELVLAAREPQAGEIVAAQGVCSTTYRNEAWPCLLQTHHNYPAATVAYVASGLGLAPYELTAVSRRLPHREPARDDLHLRRAGPVAAHGGRADRRAGSRLASGPRTPAPDRGGLHGLGPAGAARHAVGAGTPDESRCRPLAARRRDAARYTAMSGIRRSRSR